MTINDVLLRVTLAFLAGVMLGLEREIHDRASGLRATTLTCVAACLAMILAQFSIHDPIFKNLDWKPDAGLLGAGMMTGIGVIGAATIVRNSVQSRGITTAIVLWYVTIIGLIFGAGHILLGLIGWCLALAALLGLSYVERYVQREIHAVVTVTVQIGAVAESEIRDCIRSSRLRIHNASLDYDLQQRQRRFRYKIQHKREHPLDVAQKAVEKLTDLPGVTRVEWE